MKKYYLLAIAFLLTSCSVRYISYVLYNIGENDIIIHKRVIYVPHYVNDSLKYMQSNTIETVLLHPCEGHEIGSGRILSKWKPKDLKRFM
ncbi:hypothetical protein, partial [Candidatus Symbiothrix dinenymphae]|uniref:hypothetical protein n=1 Tax=Candidatus Symbiothrix dinenymphae TaxID=467085 RepID=UPI001D05375F